MKIREENRHSMMAQKDGEYGKKGEKEYRGCLGRSNNKL